MWHLPPTRWVSIGLLNHYDFYGTCDVLLQLLMHHHSMQAELKSLEALHRVCDLYIWWVGLSPVLGR